MAANSKKMINVIMTMSIPKKNTRLLNRAKCGVAAEDSSLGVVFSQDWRKQLFLFFFFVS
jgi:hypothetical protein